MSRVLRITRLLRGRCQNGVPSFSPERPKAPPTASNVPAASYNTINSLANPAKEGGSLGGSVTKNDCPCPSMDHDHILSTNNTPPFEPYAEEIDFHRREKECHENAMNKYYTLKQELKDVYGYTYLLKQHGKMRNYHREKLDKYLDMAWKEKKGRPAQKN